MKTPGVVLCYVSTRVSTIYINLNTTAVTDKEITLKIIIVLVFLKECFKVKVKLSLCYVFKLSTTPWKRTGGGKV
jgi:hypothetical protein